MIEPYAAHERISRVVKLGLDAGAESLDAAERAFERLRLVVHVGLGVAHSPTLQAAVLTAIATGSRCCLGGVFASGDLEKPLRVPWSRPCSLQDAVEEVGGKTEDVPTDVPVIVVGDAEDIKRSVALQITFNGWSAGVSPATRSVRLPEDQEFTPSGVAAGALAVSEVFQYLRGSNPMAGRRAVGLSLWQPETPWTRAGAVGPSVDRLPARLWLLGLGHLGQAYGWTLGLLPYADPRAVQIFVQDFDDVIPGNQSTGVLISDGDAGKRKARMVARWLDARGLRTSVIERRFTRDQVLQSDEPQLALAGFDNPSSRAQLDSAFPRLIDCGIGTGMQDYLGMTIRTLPASKLAAELWGQVPIPRDAGELTSLPAYQQFRQEGMDECGIVDVAGVSVGVPFVGAAASALAVSEAIRCALGYHAYEVVSLHLRTPEAVVAVPNTAWAVDPFNPGTTASIV